MDRDGWKRIALLGSAGICVFAFLGVFYVFQIQRYLLVTVDVLSILGFVYVYFASPINILSRDLYCDSLVQQIIKEFALYVISLISLLFMIARHLDESRIHPEDVLTIAIVAGIVLFALAIKFVVSRWRS